MSHMIRQLSVISVLALIAGCAQQETKAVSSGIDESRNSELLTPDLYQGGNGADASNVRYSRYTMVNTAPEAEQRDLMSQIIDVNIPGNMHPSVQDAMQYVVNRSGYALCPASTEHVNILYTRPLPAAQYKLGPMTLRNTLQVLAGPAWQVKVNEVTRGVCFTLRPGYQIPEAPRPAAPNQPVAKDAAYVSAQKAPSLDSSSSPAVVSIPPAAAAVTVNTSQPVSASTGSQLAGAAKAPTAPALVKPSPQVPASSVKAKPAEHPAASSNAVTNPVKPVAAVAAIATTPVSKPIEVAAPAIVWDAAVGSTLRQTVEAWAKKAEWQLIWAPADLDYPIEAALHFRGSFAEAITQIFPLYDGAKRSFAVDGNTSQRIVHVSERKKL